MQPQLDANEMIIELTNRFSRRVGELERECAMYSVYVKNLQKENESLKEQLNKSNK